MRSFIVNSGLLIAIALLVAGCETAAPSKATPAEPAKTEKPAMEPPPVTSPPAVQEAPKEVKPPEATMESIRDTKTTTDLQRLLTELGYKPGPIDGMRGKRTTDALKKFQIDHKLPATGELDPETVRQLQEAKP